jgi:hypothetical protein
MNKSYMEYLATISFREDELSKLLFYLPKEEKELREQLQRAGRSIFYWD